MSELILTSLTVKELQRLIKDAVLTQVHNNDTANQDEQLLTVQEAAKVLRVSAATIRTKMRAGLILYQKIGKKALFKKSNLLNFGEIKFKHSSKT